MDNNNQNLNNMNPALSSLMQSQQVQNNEITNNNFNSNQNIQNNNANNKGNKKLFIILALIVVIIVIVLIAINNKEKPNNKNNSTLDTNDVKKDDNAIDKNNLVSECELSKIVGQHYHLDTMTDEMKAKYNIGAGSILYLYKNSDVKSITLNGTTYAYSDILNVLDNYDVARNFIKNWDVIDFYDLNHKDSDGILNMTGYLPIDDELIDLVFFKFADTEDGYTNSIEINGKGNGYSTSLYWELDDENKSKYDYVKSFSYHGSEYSIVSQSSFKSRNNYSEEVIKTGHVKKIKFYGGGLFDNGKTETYITLNDGTILHNYTVNPYNNQLYSESYLIIDGFDK